MSAKPFVTVFALFDGLTQLDFTGPHQFLCRLPGAQTLVASAQGGVVQAEGLVFADVLRLSDIPACDLICVPGGLTATQAALDDAFIGEIRRLALGARYITSVCTGSLILAAAGLLKGRRAACHWAWRDLLAEFGAIPVAERVVRDGNIITGGGVTAGIDFALTVLAEVAGPDFAQAMQLAYEYAPDPPFQAGSPDTAPAAIIARYNRMTEKLMESRRAEARQAAARLAEPAGVSR